jgi:hypothetical protein
MSEEKKQVAELTEEQIEAKVKEIQTAIESFVSDPRHERYKECSENGILIKDYINSYDLDWTSADSYHTAFTALAKEGKLHLYAESKLPPPELPRAKDDLPPIGQATAADLGVGLDANQRARKTVQGVGPASSRDAYIKAAELLRNQQIPGGRLRLG